MHIYFSSPVPICNPQTREYFWRSSIGVIECSWFGLKKCSLSLVCTLCVVGCASSNDPGTPAGAVVGRAGAYDYSPSVIQTGDVQQFWWCGSGVNPTNPSQASDAILYETINASTHQTFGPVIVLAETAGSWDSEYTCNPRVVRGTFTNPLGNGQNYSYEMFYVATADADGANNSIGGAFSIDGAQWDKYPTPLIPSTSTTGYGVGQPAAYNTDQKSGITLFYEDNTPYIQHREVTSTDGVHFTNAGVLTNSGLGQIDSQPSWGDMGYDPETGYWYAAFNTLGRFTVTTDGVQERGQYGVELYRIPGSSLLSGATPWQLVKMIDTNLTGFESNFLAGFLHDQYGNINIGPYPKIQLYPTISNPAPAWDATVEEAADSGGVGQWDIGSYVWTPGQPLLALNRYSNLLTYEVTTGWTDPSAGYTLDMTLGHLYESPQKGAQTAFYGCKNGATDYFVSLDSQCEGQRILGLNGFGYARPTAGPNLVPLYRCQASGPSGAAQFVSHDPNCEGKGAGMLLGYALP